MRKVEAALLNMWPCMHVTMCPWAHRASRCVAHMDTCFSIPFYICGPMPTTTVNPDTAPAGVEHREEARPVARGVRQDQRDPWSGSQLHGVEHLQRHVERALLVQELHQAAEDPSAQRTEVARRSRSGERGPRGHWRWLGLCFRETKATTTPARSNPTKVRPRGWAASTATSSPWVRDRSRS